MKKLKFLLIFIFGFFGMVFADETLTITTYYPSPYGSYQDLYVADNLGIGTTTPGAKLDVVGNIQAQLSANTGLLRLDTSSYVHNTGPLKLRAYATDDAFNYKSVDLEFYTLNGAAGTTDGEFRIRTSDDNVLNNAFTIKSSGNVGIGTTAPEAKLDVEGNIYGWNVPKDVKVTTGSHNGNFGSYQAMYNWIQTNGCSGYHVCDATELTRYYQLHAVGTLAGWMSFPARYSSDGFDCLGWSSAGTEGYCWVSGAYSWTVWNCATAHPVMCCK